MREENPKNKNMSTRSVSVAWNAFPPAKQTIYGGTGDPPFKPVPVSAAIFGEWIVNNFSLDSR